MLHTESRAAGSSTDLSYALAGDAPADGPAYAPRDGGGLPVAISLFADRPHVREAMRADAQLAGFRVAQAEGLIEHFSTVLADNGGKVVDNEYWGVRTLAYKINKNRKGHYAFLRSDAPSDAVQEMERLARLHDDVMRVMTIRVDQHEEGPSIQMQKREERGDRRGGDRGDRRDRN